MNEKKNAKKEKGLICVIFLIVPLLIGLVLPYLLLKPSINSGVMPWWFKYVSLVVENLQNLVSTVFL